MKFRLITLIFLLFFLVPVFSFAADNIVNVFTWTNYIPQLVIQQFEKQTGITVNLSSYDSNEDMYAKLKADEQSGYDVIVPSNYFVSRMIKEDMLRPLIPSALPNRRYLNPVLLNRSFDPHNRYSYPYLWGTTAIAVDDRYWDPKSITSWADLWDKRFHNQLLLYDDAREVFSIGLLVSGHSVNTSNLQDIRDAYYQLQKIKANVRLFSTDAAANVYADNDVTVGMAESGDVILAQPANAHLVYIYPKEGFTIWEDCMAIPKYAPHYDNALKFMNFVMSPKIALEIALIQGFSTPNLVAQKLLPKKYRDNPVIYPSQEILKRGYLQGDVGTVLKWYMYYWQFFKLS